MVCSLDLRVINRVQCILDPENDECTQHERSSKARNIFDTHKKHLSPIQINKCEEMFIRYEKKIECQQQRDEIEKSLQNLDFELADSLYLAKQDTFKKLEYKELKESFLHEVPTAIWYAAINDNADRIERLLTSTDYGSLAQERLKQYSTVAEFLSKHDFSKADNEYKKFDKKPEQYFETKTKKLREYLSQKGLSIDEEKGEALADISKNVLLKARAGSGKTRAIACKAVLLCEKYDIKHDELMILAFNKAAASEIQSRVQRHVKEFDFGKTFHSFALSILKPSEGILMGSELITFLRGVIEKSFQNDSIFSSNVYKFFRKEMEDPEEDAVESRYLELRDDRYLCLDGKEVKSKGEKYISDFFFEHDINVDYEKKYDWKKRNDYKPDFTINLEQGGAFILEHWGIDKHDKNKKVAASCNKTWDEYRTEMHEKCEYWKSRKETLIETSVSDLERGRKEFEKILKERLEEFGIRCIKLSENELLERFNTIHAKSKKLYKLFEQFIQRAKKGAWTVNSSQHKIECYLKSSSSYREKAFLQCANKVLVAYQKACEKKQKIDYDDVIMMATKKILNSPDHCFAFKKDIRKFKYVLMDEFQDFSKLFSDMINAWRKHNPELKVFCVGDDWQAINGFAGSDLKYFINVDDTFKEKVNKCDLLTNYRSSQSVVNHSNNLMSNTGGEPARYRDKAEFGGVSLQYIDDAWIEARETEKDSEAYTKDRMYRWSERDEGFLMARYAKSCHEIIKKHPNKTIGIISRTNEILHKMSKHNFKGNLLKKCLTDEQEKFLDGEIDGSTEKRLKVDTAHQFKGLEREITIIIAANEKNFPTIKNSDNELFSIFGVTDEKVLEEERRLFYVALSRAKEKVYILTEKGKESRFLEEIGLIKMKEAV